MSEWQMIVALAGGLSSVVGFVAIWVRLGNWKGRQESKIQSLEYRVSKVEDSVRNSGEKADAFKDKVLVAMATLETQMSSLSEDLKEIKKKLGV